MSYNPITDVVMEYFTVITANGDGERMRPVANIAKCLLPFRGKTILAHLLERFPDAIVLSHHALNVPQSIRIAPTRCRKDTLRYLTGMRSVLIVDADIYVPSFRFACTNKDALFVYKGRNAGLYYVRSIDALLRYMKVDDIAGGMRDHQTITMRTIHLGTPEEYKAATASKAS